MNIFALSDSPVLSAVYQHDKHVVKMTLETAQLLSQAVRKRDDWQAYMSEEGAKLLYRSTHVHHPCAKWCRENISNFKWLCQHGLALADEYSHRFWRTHKSRRLIEACSRLSDELLFDGHITPFAQAMPDKYKESDPVLAYRMYYVGEKILPSSKWTNRRSDLPEWLFQHAMFG